jgi:hypothetical protein
MSGTILAIDEVCKLANVTVAPSLVDGYYQGRGMKFMFSNIYLEEEIFFGTFRSMHCGNKLQSSYGAINFF